MAGEGEACGELVANASTGHNVYVAAPVRVPRTPIEAYKLAHLDKALLEDG